MVADITTNINAKAVNNEDPKVRQKNNIQARTYNDAWTDEGNHFRSDRSNNNNIERQSIIKRPPNNSLKVGVKDKTTSEDQSKNNTYVSPRIALSYIISKESILRTEKTLIPISKGKPN